MGLHRIALTVVAFSWLQLCDAAAEPTELPSMAGTSSASEAAAAVELEPPAPSAGGTTVVTGPYVWEVAPYTDGTLLVYPRGAGSPSPARSQLSVRLSGDDGARHPVLLVWDPASGHYRGRLRGARPAAGALEVRVVVDRERYRGTARGRIVAGEAPPAVVVEVDEPEVELSADRAEPTEPTVAVEAAPAQVVVEAPAPPRPEVVVRRPRGPRARIRGRRARGRSRHRGRRARIRVRR